MALTVAGFIVIGAVVISLDTRVNSVWIAAPWVIQYGVLAVGALLTAVHMRVFVAHGVTRRSFLCGGLIFGLVISVLAGLLTEVGFLIENRAYAAAGMTQFADELNVVSSVAVTAIAAVEFTLMYAVHFIAGWLITSTYHRFNTWVGTFSLLVVILLTLLQTALQWRAPTFSGFLGQLQVGSTSTIVVFTVDLLMILLGTLAVAMMLRRVAVGVAPSVSS